MCGKAQPDGRPAAELIETLVLLFGSPVVAKYTCNYNQILGFTP